MSERGLAASLLVVAMATGVGLLCGLLGFPSRFLTLACLVALAAHGGWSATFLVLRGGPITERLLAALGFSVLSVVLVVLCTGSAGWLRPAVVLPAQALVWSAVRLAGRGGAPRADWGPVLGALRFAPGHRLLGLAAYVGVACVFSVTLIGLFRPGFEFDVLTNHLHAPARWLQTGSLQLVPTYFGAGTAEYEPMGNEAFYAWLMIPFHGDLVARFGQLASWVALWLGLYAVARRLGLAAGRAAIAPLTLPLLVPLLAQAEGAMVDLALAAWFVAALAFLLRHRDDRASGALVVAGVFLGLYLGSKFTALAYLPVLLAFSLPSVLRGGRPRLGLAARLVLPALPGAYWYVRNWLVAGNPLYPLRIEAGGTTLFEGAFGKEQIEAWVFNLRIPGEAWTNFFDILAAGFGRARLGHPHLGLLLPSALLVGGLAVAMAGPPRGLRWRRVSLVAAVPILLLIFWFLLPSHATRLAFPALALFPLCPALVAGAGRRARGALIASLVLQVLLCHGHYVRFLPFAAFIGVAVLGASAVVIWARHVQPSLDRPDAQDRRTPPRSPTRAVDSRRLLVGRVTATVAVAAVLAASWVADRHPRPSRRAEFARWPGLGEIWNWTDANLAGARIAYAGHNVPYFLLGPHLENAVFYVNTDRHRDWQFHDYERHQRGRRARPYTSEPAYYRMTLDERAWLANLEASGAQYLVVSSLFPNELVNIRHAADRTIAEDGWAADRPRIFRRVAWNDVARIYRLDFSSRPTRFTDPVEREEIDAVELYLKDPALLRRHYPHATELLLKEERLLDYAIGRRRREPPPP